MSNVFVILDATGYPIDCYLSKDDADAECARRNFHNLGLRVLRLHVKKAAP